MQILLILLAVTAFSQARSRLAEYAVILEDAPVAQMSASRSELFSARMQPHLDRIRIAQRSVLSELSRRGVGVIGTNQVLVNAIFVSADRETAAKLLTIPGVAHVRYLPPLKPTLNTAAGLINAAQAQALAPGGAANAGAGVKIGIIDSGIDQNHPGFQDSSLTVPDGFPKGDSAFTNNKVIVARSFVQWTPWTDPDSRNSVPDDISPRDHVGHGTAIAMIAAGVRNQGPLAEIQGIAPKAFLGNYKVQGSPSVNPYPASTYAVIQALHAALQDGMDIVTVAYNEGDTPRFGPLDVDPQACGGNTENNPHNYCDPLAQVVETAVSQGLVVIAGAGNDGNSGPKFPTLNSIHSPGTAPSAITVTASTNSHALYQAVRAVSPNPPSNLQKIKALFGDGPQVQQALTAPIIDVTRLGNDGNACTALSGLDGAIALIQRGVCAFSDKVTNAQRGGAIAAIIVQSQGEETPYSSWGATDTGIPAMMVGYTDGLALKTWVDQSSNARVTLDPTFAAYDATPGAIADFASRGPASGTTDGRPVFYLKPEIAAPGTNIYTATQKTDPNSVMYSPSGYTAASGTSMAAGMAAGAAALVLQKNSALTPGQVKSALVNTATPDSSYSVNDTGAGKLDAAAAVAATTAFEPAALEFGLIGAASLPINLVLTVSNTSSSAQAVSLSVIPRTSDSRASVTLSANSLTIGAGQNSTVTVRLQGSQPNPGSYEGAIQATVGNATYRIPYQYLVTSGVVDAMNPVLGGFVGATEDTGWLIGFKAIDAYGIPQVGAAVQWNAICSDGSIKPWQSGCAAAQGGSFTHNASNTYFLDDHTTANGFAGAQVDLGTQPGDQLFQAVMGTQSLTFFGYARGYQTINQNGVVDAATSKPFQQGFAPGSYISIYGNYLAPTYQPFTTMELPYGLSDTSVAFYAANGRFPGRLHFVSPNQINVQIPWELVGQSSAGLIVRVGWAPSAEYTIPLGTFTPGVFGNGTAILDWPDNNLVTTSNPAKRGQPIQLFVNGLGPTDTQQSSGQPAPTAGLVFTTNQPTVTIGGKNANVSFSGMAPGFVGLYQVNVFVPDDAPTGVQKMAISIGGVTSAETDLPIQ
jgi:uncharacterized protein (TIGR03437 family)